MPAERFPSQRNGFALIVVLIVIVILSGIAIVVSHGSREEAAISSNFGIAMQRESLAEGAMVFAGYRLLSNHPEQDWIPDGRPNRLRLFDTEITISVQDESGRISLNTSDEATLSHAFINAGIEITKAQGLAATILDWRDPDDSRRVHGAERQDYLRAGVSGSPANAPFVRTDELLGVLGMTDDNYRRIAPIVSAYSMYRNVNLGVAPPSVLTALFGPGSPEISTILGKRSSVPTDSQAPRFFSDLSSRNDSSRDSSPAPPTATTYSALIALTGSTTPEQVYYGAFRIARDRHGPRIAIVENVKLTGPGAPH